MVSNDALLEQVIKGLAANKTVFQHLLSRLSPEQYSWKPEPSKWCLLEVVCHLYDEEREDFRTRVKHILEKRSGAFPSIDPQGWVVSRNYLNENYEAKIELFLTEREHSVNWLSSLINPAWNNTYQHPTLGTMTAGLLLSNWLAHDYLHFRQITRLKYEYLKELSGEKLDYAGTW